MACGGHGLLDAMCIFGFIGGLLVAFYCVGSIAFMRTAKRKIIRATVAAAGICCAITAWAITPG
jgi:hypothetical protein